MNSNINYFVFLFIACIIAFLFLKVYYNWIFGKSHIVNGFDFCFFIILGFILIIISGSIQGAYSSIILGTVYSILFFLLLIYFIFN